MKTLSISLTQESTLGTKERLFALDLLKAISIVMVVSYHSIFVPRATYSDSLQFMEILAAPLRFCVPVLFTISFLLLERGIATSSDPKTSMKQRIERLGKPIVFWFAVATFVKLLAGNSPQDLTLSLLQGQIFQGAYYILVLLQFLFIYLWIRKLIYVQVMSILLQCFIFLGVVGSLNHWFGEQTIEQLRLLHRPLLIYWLAYVGLGILFWQNWAKLKEISHKIPVLIKGFLVLGTGGLMAYEYSYLYLITQGRVAPFEYVMYSCLLSVVVYFLCFASVKEDQCSPKVRQMIMMLSNYCLGIFCINGVFSEYFMALGSRLFTGSHFDGVEILEIKAIGWIFLLVFSLGCSILLDRIGLKEVVR